ncbi:anti-sigma factor antagonist [Rhodococcus sp. HM1]|uniref:anti-sigma factor antagonist n=1 Tax=unclassified Rhodococcus (in: high G+C Gram-positive bacteria) TaxID=192944 RepID=UPI0018CD8158|nr:MULTISPECIES: anti-sigma factor antagonist [unclassified Rhodococcus (in: high G+C Gram-positive bacteria)]MBH0120416.1 anti-sigma factor antagonist [Rhodococcus sp. CX]MCK8673843.1 anti-sigma factor antagonist [Rhodococcus sp. HM1]
MPEITPGSQLRLDVDFTEGVAVLHAAGEIDVVTAPAFERKLTELAALCGTSTLVADLLDVQFLSSAGLAVLMRTADELEGRSRFLIVADGPATARPMVLVGLAETLEIFPTLEAALSTV